MVVLRTGQIVATKVWPTRFAGILDVRENRAKSKFQGFGLDNWRHVIGIY